MAATRTNLQTDVSALSHSAAFRQCGRPDLLEGASPDCRNLSRRCQPSRMSHLPNEPTEAFGLLALVQERVLQHGDWLRQQKVDTHTLGLRDRGGVEGQFKTSANMDRSGCWVRS
jgi:hypothetical protein